MSHLSLYRRLYRELRIAGSLAPVWDYVVKETRQFNGDHKIMKERLEQLSLYVDYLENSRLHQDLIKKYTGKGELSVEESARIVGLKLPQEPR
ncbi:protein FMC1 homolog [Dysidea avara]|uniref:protein FMC1 homolog n=1 Tax=Dysidea avara TaxID=196820 RepID=UPI003333A9B3